MRNICALAGWETKDWLERQIPPNCKKHKHLTKLEAMEMTCRGESSPYARPIAEWIGPRQVKMLTCFEWKMIDRWKFPRYNLLPQGSNGRPA